MLLVAAKAAVVALLAACVLTLLMTAPTPADGSHKPQVAIVGGGVGGAAAAHFVRRLCGEQVGIHVFERQHIGGRLKSMQFEGSTYELGGSVVYQDNIYIRCRPSRRSCVDGNVASKAALVSTASVQPEAWVGTTSL